MYLPLFQLDNNCSAFSVAILSNSFISLYFSLVDCTFPFNSLIFFSYSLVVEVLLKFEFDTISKVFANELYPLSNSAVLLFKFSSAFFWASSLIFFLVFSSLAYSIIPALPVLINPFFVPPPYLLVNFPNSSCAFSSPLAALSWSSLIFLSFLGLILL